MKTSTSNVLLASTISVVSFVANFITFVFNYNRLVTPYLHEEQRVENANFIMKMTLSSFAVTALLTGLVIYFLLHRKNRITKK